MYIEKKIIDKERIIATKIFPIFDTLLEGIILGYNKDASFYLSATDPLGTNPTLTITIASVIGLQTIAIRFPLVTFTQLTAAGKELKEATKCPRNIEITATLGGTDPTWLVDLWIVRQ